MILRIRYWLETHGLIKTRVEESSGNIGFDIGLVKDLLDYSWVDDYNNLSNQELLNIIGIHGRIGTPSRRAAIELIKRLDGKCDG